MQNKIYTLIRPVLDYEESETTFAAFLTREAAEAARQEIINFWKNLKESIGEAPPSQTDEEWRVYEEWDTWAQEKIDNAIWPYNCRETYQYKFLYYGNAPEEEVQISEIPLF